MVTRKKVKEREDEKKTKREEDLGDTTTARAESQTTRTPALGQIPAGTTPQQPTFNINEQQVTKEQFEAQRIASGGQRRTLTDRVLTAEEQQAQIQTRAQEIRATPTPTEVERQRLLAEEQPERRELDPNRQLGEQVPVLGGSVTAGRIIGEDIKDALGLQVRERLVSPEELRSVALTKIEEQQIEKGVTASEKFGAFVEGIPIAGSIASKFAGGLIETPSGNVRTILKELRTEKTRATNIESQVRQGILPVSTATDQISDIELNIQRLESRIKLLVANSPELKFNSDEVNQIETRILQARERIFQAKINILAGASSDPTELAILRTLDKDVEDE